MRVFALFVQFEPPTGVVLHYTYQFVDWPPEIAILYKITIRFQFSESTGLPSLEPTSTRTTEERWQPPMPRHQMDGDDDGTMNIHEMGAHRRTQQTRSSTIG